MPSRPSLQAWAKTVRPSPSMWSLNRMPGLARRPDPNSNARLWTSLFTGRPVGFLELYPFLPDGAHFVPGKQALIFDVRNAIG
jgi:hypothetical protein